MKRPNNFPREGLHTPVTRAAIKTLERERPTLNVERHYTIEGEVETTVHSNLNAEREAAIITGARRLHQASDQVRTNFGATKPDARTEYIRAQRAAARGPAKQHIRKYTPSR